MNDSTLALIAAVLIAILPNVILKLFEKYRTPQEKEKGELEAADLSVETLKAALEEMRAHNKFLEEKLTTKREEITIQNKIIYDLNTQNSELTNRIVELSKQLSQCVDECNKFKIEFSKEK